ncbi:hypothetical protein LINPERHAP1_LOCUS26943 [Linum perenne]
MDTLCVPGASLGFTTVAPLADTSSATSDVWH